MNPCATGQFAKENEGIMQDGETAGSALERKFEAPDP